MKARKRLLALLLAISMILGMAPLDVYATELETSNEISEETSEVVNSTEEVIEQADIEALSTGQEPLAVVWSGSDFQYSKSGNTDEQNAEKNQALLNEILTAMKQDGYTNVDEALFPGDLTPASGKDASNIGANTVLETLNETWGLNADDVIFATGNHDSAGFDLNDATGGYDREHYSVYNINYNGFPCYGNVSVIQNTANALKAWLDAKAETGYAKPIFVMTHLPLHHNWRYDNSNAKYIVDVLNEAGKRGLNIIFLFGHNHSGGYDRYLGGSCIYYAPGSTMLVSTPNGSVEDFTSETIHFTYMNAGYVGYAATGESGSTLSGTIFEIYEDRVEIAKYNKDGLCNLKNIGSNCSSSKPEQADPKDSDGNYLWNADTTSTPSAQILNLSNIVLSKDLEKTTLGKTLEKGCSAQVAITVEADENYSVEWKSYDENIATVSKEADEITATITAIGNGTTTIQATVRENTTAKAAGVPATISFEVAVAPENAVQFMGKEENTFYKLVENLEEELETNKKYMILSAKELGNAKAFGGYYGLPQEKVNKTVAIFNMPLGVIDAEAVYTVPTDNNLLWTFVDSKNTDATEYHLKGNAAGTYLGIRDSEPGNLRYTSTATGSGATALVRVEGNVVKSLRNNNYSATPVDNSWGELTLNYSSAGGYFQLAKTDETGEAVYFFEQAETLKDIWMWVEGNSGTTVVNGTGATGGTVVIMHDGVATEIPITTDMLVDAYLSVPGTRTCSVRYNGQILSEDYQLTVTNESGENVDVVTLLENNGNLYKWEKQTTSTVVAGNVYMFVDNTADRITGIVKPGAGHAIGAGDNGVEPYETNVFEKEINGEIGYYVWAESDYVLWEIENATGSLKYVKNKATGEYLTIDKVFESDAQKNEVTMVEDSNSASQWYASSDNSSFLRNRKAGDATYDYSVFYDENSDSYYAKAGSGVYAGRSWYYVLSDLDRILAYVDQGSGQVAIGETGKIVPGGNIVVKTFMKDGTCETENIPITLDMLDITLEDLLTPGEHICTVTYDGKVISNHYKLTVTGTITGLTMVTDTLAAMLSDNKASVPLGAGGNVLTGDNIIYYTYEDGVISKESVPITIGMLSTTNKQLNTTGSYSELTVTDDNRVVANNYELEVYKTAANDYPEFPDEGAVKIDKWADTSSYDYFETGSAQVNLSVSGIPSHGKANAVIVVDASSSMRICVHGVSEAPANKWTEEEHEMFVSFLKTDINRALTTEEAELFQRLYDEQKDLDDNYIKYFHERMNASPTDTNQYAQYATKWLAKAGYCTASGKFSGSDPQDCPTREKILEDSMVKMLEDFAAEDESGYVPDVDVAISYFNTYTQIDNNYLVKDTGTHFGPSPTTGGEVILNFTNSADLNEEIIENVRASYKTESGTNYDDGLQQAYDLLSAKQISDYQEYLAQVEAGLTDEEFEPRQDFVIFMSDGQPYQFNYFGGNIGNWLKWCSGKLDEMLPEGQTYADAGFVEEEYLDVFEEYYHPDGKLWMAEAIKGDETQKYKIIDPSANTEKHIRYVNGLGATMLTVGFNLGESGDVHDTMRRIATSNGYYTACETAADIENAFGAFTALVRSANNAVFKDQMGDAFNLQMKTRYATGVEGEEVVLNPAPKIQLKKYAIYKHSETTDETLIGKRKDEPAAILEEVTFSPDGTKAYSNKLGEDNNILIDEVICASNFWYNTSPITAKTITVNGQKVSLEPETFYWRVGSITEDELVLSYYVYLADSMEGKREAGSYDTNNFADLTYTNYLGNECKQSVASPVLPWKQASVGYGFYLVNEEGKPIINQTTGKTGTFEQAIRLTEPIYQDVLFNTQEDVAAEHAFRAIDELPDDAYILFDEEAAYKLTIKSSGEGSWLITNDETLKDKNGNEILTTYVTQYSDSETSTTAKVGNDDSYSYTNTVVWFAIKANVKCIPDTVVIDYGLPVDINVLANDTMMGSNATLKAIGTTANRPENMSPIEESNEALQDGFKTSLSTTDGLRFGSAKVQNGEVRYSVETTEMLDAETFLYGVEYTGENTLAAKGYYYSTVTVIPATTIYYEESFVDFNVYNVNDFALNTEPSKQWQTVGTEQDAVQAEDRPGYFNLSALDANNIYGTDGAYSKCAQYSLGSAKKVTVNGTVFGEAVFDFWGTGFDIVSLTSGDSGNIVVDVFDAAVYAEYWNKVAAGENAVYPRALKTYFVDTYYGYIYGDKDGDGNKEWYVDETSTDTLYQVPVMKVDGLAYGNYTAVITADYNTTFDHQNNGYFDIYLDAIRIYDPANDGNNNTVIKDAYVSDKEGWPEYYELRNMLIDANTFASHDEEQITEGIIFIDGNAALTDANASHKNPLTDKANAVSDYANFGPNNELYLAPGQAVTFDMNFPGDVAGVYLAMKSVGGETAVKFWDADSARIDDINSKEVTTATDMYYSITSLNGDTVVIYNDGDEVLSITNIKVTYNTAPQVNNGEKKMMFSVGRPSVTKALRSMSIQEEVIAPDVNEPGGNAPGTDTPGTDIPGTNEPGASTPGASTPGTNDSTPGTAGNGGTSVNRPSGNSSVTFGPVVEKNEVKDTTEDGVTEVKPESSEKTDKETQKEVVEEEIEQDTSKGVFATLWDMIKTFFTKLISGFLGLWK